MNTYYLEKLREYEKDHIVWDGVIYFTLLISIKNTPLNELTTTYHEYKATLQNYDEIEEYIEWIVKEYE